MTDQLIDHVRSQGFIPIYLDESPKRSGAEDAHLLVPMAERRPAVVLEEERAVDVVP